MSTNTPKKDPLSSLFGQAPGPSELGAELGAEGSDMPEPAHVRTVKPVSRPMPPPVIPPSPNAGPDPRQLAKMLAKAAVAKAAASSTTPTARSSPRLDGDKPRVEAKPVVRGVAAAPPPMRKLSALEAMEQARKQEAEQAAAPAPSVPAAPAFSPAPTAAPAAASSRTSARPAESAPREANRAAPQTPAAPDISDDQLGDVVQAVLGTGLPGAQVYVANAMFAEDRKALSALWRSHRARFLATHQVEYAVGASIVLHHLHNAAPRQLAAAHAVTDKGEFLLWVDVAQRVVITAFANPRQLVAGW